jgi:hypothetical protein
MERSLYRGKKEVDMNKEPTQEEIKRFWDWCGFWYDKSQTTGLVMDIGWRNPDGKVLNGCHISYLPSINLNSLFKWAVPKLSLDKMRGKIEFSLYNNKWKCILGDYGSSDWGSGWQTDVFQVEFAETPALALFWAINKIIEEGGD